MQLSKYLSGMAFWLLGSVALYAQGPTLDVIKAVRFNGRAWVKYGMAEKVNFILGIQDGIILYSENSRDKETINSLIVTDPKGGTLVSEMDRFFEQTANLNIPIYAAYFYLVQKLNGLPAAELEGSAAKLREKYKDYK